MLMSHHGRLRVCRSVGAAGILSSGTSLPRAAIFTITGVEFADMALDPSYVPILYSIQTKGCEGVAPRGVTTWDIPSLELFHLEA